MFPFIFDACKVSIMKCPDTRIIVFSGTKEQRYGQIINKYQSHDTRTLI
jgi:hypothetical protein